MQALLPTAEVGKTALKAQCISFADATSLNDMAKKKATTNRQITNRRAVCSVCLVSMFRSKMLRDSAAGIPLAIHSYSQHLEHLYSLQLKAECIL